MSRLPRLEAQLVAAAAARRRRVRAPRRLVAGGLAATAAAAGAVLLFAPRRDAPVFVPAAEGVPAATLALSRELVAAPAPEKTRVTHPQLAAVAAEIEARTPYPPGMRDDFDWEGTPANPRAMSSVNDRATVQFLVEYRSYCLWLEYWLAGDDRAGAATVIADIPRWPTQRQPEGYERPLQADKVAAVQSGDVAPIQREVSINCRGVGTAIP